MRRRTLLTGSLAVAAAAGVSTAAGSVAGTGPVITVGSKQFTESWVMGELYAQILTARGFQVVLKSNIGSADIIDRALRSRQIDLYPEYTGVILQTFAMPKRMPVTAHGTYEAAKRFEEGRGLTLLRPTPFQNRNAVAVRTSDARKHGLRTVGDLRRMGRISYAEYPDNITGPLGYDAIVKAYRLSAMKVRPLNIGLQYPALKNGDVDAADVFTTDPQLRRYDFTVLEDDQAIFGFQNVSPVVRRSLVERYGSRLTEPLDAVNALLTEKAMQALNEAAAMMRLSPAKVADRFLRANDLK
ncbi:glycine betaine ABC transporter substrate-binding protein [Streptomyces sp. NPDC058287]|uniref:ABC transporter substrate-binding protein n=1 Tax=unclassified Streptomyces TaxID=2593676 RepID=UPI0036E2877F